MRTHPASERGPAVRAVDAVLPLRHAFQKIAPKERGCFLALLHTKDSMTLDSEIDPGGDAADEEIAFH